MLNNAARQQRSVGLESIATLLSIASLIAAWFFTVKKLSALNVILRHLIGMSAGAVSMLAAVAIFISLGMIEPQEQQDKALPAPVESTKSLGQDVKHEIDTATDNKIDTQEQAPKEALVVTGVETAEELDDEAEEDAFGPESQAILDNFKPRMSVLVKSGLSMEPLRQSNSMADLAQCGDLMRKNQAELRILRDEFWAALKELPAGQGLAHPNFEPLYNAEANLVRCVTCVPTALPDCQEAARALDIK